jgi:hypothetical protein
MLTFVLTTVTAPLTLRPPSTDEFMLPAVFVFDVMCRPGSVCPRASVSHEAKPKIMASGSATSRACCAFCCPSYSLTVADATVRDNSARRAALDTRPTTKPHGCRPRPKAVASHRSGRKAKGQKARAGKLVCFPALAF